MTHSIVVVTNVEVPIRDGTTLRADVYRSEHGRHPALLIRTPYGKEYLPTLLVSIDPLRAVRQGFAVVAQDTRGRFASEGEFEPFREGLDGHDTVRWVAQQPWCNGNVGMFGSSYMAAAQLQAAVERPPQLLAMAPAQASSDYYEGRSYRGGAFELGSLVTIVLWGLARGSLSRLASSRDEFRAGMAAVREAMTDLDSLLAVRPLSRLQDGILGRVAPYFFDWAAHEQADDYWAALSIEHRYGDVAAAGLHITGWFDPFHVGTIRNFAGLAAQANAGNGCRQTLLVGPWPHFISRGMTAGRLGAVEFGQDAGLDVEGMQLRWFARQLMDGDAAEQEEAAAVRYFMMGQNTWRDADRWPPSDETCQLYLQPDHSLDFDPHPEVALDTYAFDPREPVPTYGGAHLVLESRYPPGPLDHRHIEPRQDVLVYTSAPLDGGLDIVGWVEAALMVRSSAPSTDFTVKLLQLYADGRLVNVVDGIRRVRFAPDISMSWTLVTVELGATALHVPAGHRLQVHVSSSNYPRFDVNPNTGELPFTARESVVARQQVCVGGENSSHLVLPLLTGRHPCKTTTSSTEEGERA